MKLSNPVKKWSDAVYQHIVPDSQPERLTTKAFEKLSERYRLSEFLTYRYADEIGIWLADNNQGMDSLLVGIELCPLIVAGEKTAAKLEAILSRLPVGSVVHSVAHATGDIDEYLEHWVKARQQGRRALYEQMTQRRRDYFLKWAKGDGNFLKENRYRPRMLRYYWFVRLPALLTEVSTSKYDAFLKEATHTIDWMIAELKSGQFNPSLLGGVSLIQCLKQLINCHRAPSALREEPVSFSTPVNQQLLSPETSVQVGQQGNLYFSDCRNLSASGKPAQSRVCSVMSITQFPDSPFFLSQMAELIGSIHQGNGYLAGEFYAFTIFHRLPIDTVKFRAGKKMAVLQYQTRSSKEFWQQIMRPLYQRKIHVQELYDAFDKRGHKPVRAWVGLVMSESNEKRLSESVSMAQSLAKSIGMTLSVEAAIAVPAWLASLPGQYREGLDEAECGLQRGTTMKAKNAATLAHVQGDWRGSAPIQGGLLALNRRGALATLNLFDTYKSNYNAVMAASSGSGKSFMVNEMIVDFLARGGIARVIDAGRSYYNTAEVMGGQNVVFDREKGFCINPFSSIYTEADLQEDMDTLVMLIAQMAFPFGFGQDANSGESKPYEYRCIEAAIEKMWAVKKEALSVRDLADYFSSHQEEKLCKISQQLRPWAYGRYASWMVGQANIIFNNPFLVLELDDLSDEPELQSIVLNLILAKISREMYLSAKQELSEHGRPLPKLIVIDEAWDLLNRPNTGAFIEKAYRRARKYACAVLIVTQSFTDCDKTSAARTALENANWIISLVHDVGALEKATEKNLLTISPYSKAMIKGLQKTDSYSEFYVINKSVKGEGLYRLIVDPAAYWMYTTEAAERSQLNALIKQGVSLDEAIQQLANRRL